MPVAKHIEQHFTGSAIVRDVVIGMSDGLTVPFALAAGLSGAVDSTAIIVTAGFAEIAAGSIAMGLGGFLAGKTDVEHYQTERARELRETHELPEVEAEEVAAIFRSYGLPDEVVDNVVRAISADRNRWVDFMMRFELGLEEPDPKRARTSAWVIAVSYILGGMVPLFPYMVMTSVRGTGGVDRGHAIGTGRFWVRERPVHSRKAVAQCLANDASGRAGRHGRVCDRPADWVRTASHHAAWNRQRPSVMATPIAARAGPE